MHSTTYVVNCLFASMVAKSLPSAGKKESVGPFEGNGDLGTIYRIKAPYECAGSTVP